MLRFNNNFFAIATAFFASSLFQPISVFAEEVQEEEFFDDEFEEEVPVKKIEKKTVLEDLKESLEVGGNVKGVFSYTGIPSSGIKFIANDFRPFSLRLCGEKGFPLNSSFDAGVKASLSLGKTFKNDAGKNILKVNLSFELDQYNDKLENFKEEPIKIGSAKGIFFDCFKIGYDKEFVTGAKGMLIGGMWKINDLFTLNFDIMRDLDFIDLDKDHKNLFLETSTELDEDGKIKNSKNYFSYSNPIPAFGIQGQIKIGNLGNVKIGYLGRPMLINTSVKDDKSVFLWGNGVNISSDFSFIKNVDKLGINVLFGSSIGEFNPKMKACAEKSGFMLNVGGKKVTTIPASCFCLEKKHLSDDEHAVYSNLFINTGVDYSFKITPAHEVSVGISDFHVFYTEALEKFLEEKIAVKNMLTGNLGYKFSACKKLDFSVTANFVKAFLNVDSEKITDSLNDDQKKLFQTWGWNLMFGADFKF